MTAIEGAVLTGALLGLGGFFFVLWVRAARGWGAEAEAHRRSMDAHASVVRQLIEEQDARAALRVELADERHRRERAEDSVYVLEAEKQQLRAEADGLRAGRS